MYDPLLSKFKPDERLPIDSRSNPPKDDGPWIVEPVVHGNYDIWTMIISGIIGALMLLGLEFIFRLLGTVSTT